MLERCRRIAVLGVCDGPDSPSYVTVEKLLGLALEIIPISPDRETLFGMRCYRTLKDVPGKIDIVLVYSLDGIDLVDLARVAVERGVTTFWVEEGGAAFKRGRGVF